MVAAAQAEHEKRVRISELPDDTPLEAVLQYTAGPGMFTTDPPEEARRRIRKLPDRQAQAEALLEKGNDLLLVQLNTLDLTVTPELCRLARRNLQQLAAKWETEDPGSQVDYFLGPHTVPARARLPVRAGDRRLDEGSGPASRLL